MKILAILISLALIPGFGWAQDVAPATSDDLRQFDKMVGRQRARDLERKNDRNGRRPLRPNRFGSTISREAKKLKEEDKSKFGNWVRRQQRQDSQMRQEPPLPGHGLGIEPPLRPDLRGQIPVAPPFPGGPPPPPPPK